MSSSIFADRRCIHGGRLKNIYWSENISHPIPPQNYRSQVLIPAPSLIDKLASSQRWLLCNASIVQALMSYVPCIRRQLPCPVGDN